jgi:chorismate dehydratase
MMPEPPYTEAVRIGSVPYLNARPLVDAFERVPRPGVELIYDVPSRLITRLLAGELDVAMASTFAVIAHPSLRLLPGLGVACTGPAWSVRLLSKVPPAEIRTLALDAASRSSSALTRIVLADGYGVTPACVEMPADPDAMLAANDAALLIGDIGLSVPADGLLDLDVGQMWYDLTGLPFLFAGWVARDEQTLAQVRPWLTAALDAGLTRLHPIAAAEALRLDLPQARVYAYLTDVMHYHTDPADEAGLAEFARRSTKLGLL